MKHLYSYCLFLLLVSNITYSQDTIRIYFDKNWNEITDKTEAVFYRKAFPGNNKMWVVNDYFISDNIQMTGSYKSGKLKIQQGLSSYYYENGHKSSEGLFAKDKKTGEWTYWFENGQKKTAGEFIADKKEGEWQYWSETGFVDTKEFFIKGVITSAAGFYENGQTRYSGEYTNGKKQGEWTSWNANGRIIFQGSYSYGLKQGEWIRYFSDGSMRLFYDNGVLEGNPLGGIVRRK